MIIYNDDLLQDKGGGFPVFLETWLSSLLNFNYWIKIKWL
jgi:hypothetical protein